MHSGNKKKKKKELALTYLHKVLVCTNATHIAMLHISCNFLGCHFIICFQYTTRTEHTHTPHNRSAECLMADDTRLILISIPCPFIPLFRKPMNRIARCKMPTFVASESNRELISRFVDMWLSRPPEALLSSL